MANLKAKRNVKSQTRSGYRCEHKGCGGFTKVLRTLRQGVAVIRYRRCTTCGTRATTQETRHGTFREAK